MYQLCNNQMNIPPYKNYPIISNDRISLRQIHNSDIKNIIEISFYDAVQATTLQQATEMISKIHQDYSDGNSIHWGIVDNISRNIVGTCGFYRGFDKAEGEVGCVLLPKYRSQGYMASAMLLVIDYGIKEIGLNRIWAITNQQNERAIKLLEISNFIKIRELDEFEVEYEFNSHSKI